MRTTRQFLRHALLAEHAIACSDAAVSYRIEFDAMPRADHMLKLAVAQAGGFLEASLPRYSASLLQRNLGRQRRLRSLKMPQRASFYLNSSALLFLWTRLVKCLRWVFRLLCSLLIVLLRTMARFLAQPFMLVPRATAQ